MGILVVGGIYDKISPNSDEKTLSEKFSSTLIISKTWTIEKKNLLQKNLLLV